MKRAMYGTKLMVFDPETRTADLYNVENTTETLKNWVAVGSSAKHIDNLSDDQLARLEALWVEHGKVMEVAHV